MIEMPREGSIVGIGAADDREQVGDPHLFHPVAADIHCFRPEMTQESPTSPRGGAHAFSW